MTFLLLPLKTGFTPVMSLLVGSPPTNLFFVGSQLIAASRMGEAYALREAIDFAAGPHFEIVDSQETLDVYAASFIKQSLAGETYHG